MTDNRPSELPIGDNLTDQGMMPRFHSAHPAFGDGVPGAAQPPRDVLMAIAGKSSQHGAEHLRQQAAELAQHLQTCERDLSHWEATLNARYATHDDQVRSARLWLQEKQQELAVREGELQERLQQVQEQAAERDRQHVSWETQRQSLEQSLQQQQRQLQADCSATQALNAQLRRQIEEQQEIAHDKQACRTLCAELEQVRAVLREREAGLVGDRRVWELQKEHWQQQTRRQRQAIARHWQLRVHALRAQQQQQRLRREQLDQRQQALEQLQAKLFGEQREMLEARLALELVRNRVPAHVAPGEVAAVHSRVREFLDSQLTAQESSRQRQRQDLQSLAATLQQQQEGLALRHEALQRWTQERQQELDGQHARLQTQEQELERLRQQLVHDRQAWLVTLDEELANATKKASCL